MSLNLPLRVITSVLFTTNKCSAFEAQTFHMHTSGQPVGGGVGQRATHDMPARSRHNNIHTQSTYTRLGCRNLCNFLPLTLNKPLFLGLSTLNCFDIGYICPYNPLTAPNLLFTNTPQLSMRLSKRRLLNNRSLRYSPYASLYYAGIGVVPKMDGVWRLLIIFAPPQAIALTISSVKMTIHYSTNL